MTSCNEVKGYLTFIFDFQEGARIADLERRLEAAKQELAQERQNRQQSSSRISTLEQQLAAAQQTQVWSCLPHLFCVPVVDRRF